MSETVAAMRFSFQQSKRFRSPTHFRAGDVGLVHKSICKTFYRMKAKIEKYSTRTTCILVRVAFCI